MEFKPYEDQEELKTVQRVSTKILAEFDRVCRELNIPYAVYAGTALGAVRHKGFIPWDDDVDVVVPRREYQRFLARASDVMGPEYLINSGYTEPTFPFSWAHFGLKGTLFIPDYDPKGTYRQPLSIDVFPLDKVPDDERLFDAQIRRAWFWSRLKAIRSTPSPELAFEGVMKTIVNAICVIGHWGMRLLRVSPVFLQKKSDQARCKYEKVTTQRIADLSGADPRSWTMTYEDIFPAVDAPFEDITVKLPRNYDKVLTNGYGNYMQLPPVAERRNHHPYLVDTAGF